MHASVLNARQIALHLWDGRLNPYAERTLASNEQYYETKDQFLNEEQISGSTDRHSNLYLGLERRVAEGRLFHS